MVCAVLFRDIFLLSWMGMKTDRMVTSGMVNHFLKSGSHRFHVDRPSQMSSRCRIQRGKSPFRASSCFLHMKKMNILEHFRWSISIVVESYRICSNLTESGSICSIWWHPFTQCEGKSILLGIQGTPVGTIDMRQGKRVVSFYSFSLSVWTLE